MPPLADGQNDFGDSLSLEIFLESGERIVIKDWTRYSFNNDFLVPTDGFSFELAGPNAGDTYALLAAGQKVQLRLNDNIQATGYVDNIDIECNRSGGTLVRVCGRDVLGQVCDSCLDPDIRISAGDTFESAMVKVFSSFGFSNFQFDDVANRNIITGGALGKVRYFKHAKAAAKSLQRQITHQLKPTISEGVFDYAERVAKRFGLHIWVGAEGDTVYVSDADFDQPTIFNLYHSKGELYGPLNNVLSSNVTVDWANQPSVIVVEGTSGGGNFRRETAKVLRVNELVAYDANGKLLPSVQKVVDKYKNTKGSVLIPKLDSLTSSIPVTARDICRPLFKYDDESYEQERLIAYANRQMSEHQQKFLQVQYVVPGHTQNGIPWAVNTMVNVRDDVVGINGKLWVKSRTFTKDRTSGTRTILTLILPYSLVF